MFVKISLVFCALRSFNLRGKKLSCWWECDNIDFKNLFRALYDSHR